RCTGHIRGRNGLDSFSIHARSTVLTMLFAFVSGRRLPSPRAHPNVHNLIPLLLVHPKVPTTVASCDACVVLPQPQLLPDLELLLRLRGLLLPARAPLEDSVLLRHPADHPPRVVLHVARRQLHAVAAPRRRDGHPLVGLARLSAKGQAASAHEALVRAIGTA